MRFWMGISTLGLTKPVLFGLRHGWSDSVIEMTASAVITLPFVVYLFAAARRTYAELAVANRVQDTPPLELGRRGADSVPFRPLLHEFLRD